MAAPQRPKQIASLTLLLLLVTTTNASEGKRLEPELIEEMSWSPLVKNPFFLSIVADWIFGNATSGTEGLDPREAGSSCSWIGNLECPSGNSSFELRCVGEGVVDCSGECPGEEALLDDALDRLEDRTLLEEFLVMTAMGERTEELDKGRPLPVLVDLANRCGFKKYQALFELTAEKKYGLYGFSLGDAEPRPGSVGQVAADAVSGFDAHYYYSYEDEAEDVEVTATIATTTTTTKTTTVAKNEPIIEIRRKPDFILKCYLDDEDNFGVEQNKTIVSLRRKKRSLTPDYDDYYSQADYYSGEEDKGQRQTVYKPRLLRDLCRFGDVVTSATGKMAVLTSGHSIRAVEEGERDLISYLEGMDEEKLRALQKFVIDYRKTRNTGFLGLDPWSEKCRVVNMACVEIPKIGQCRGIGIGECITKYEMAKRMVEKNLPSFCALSGLVVILAVVLCWCCNCYCCGWCVGCKRAYKEAPAADVATVSPEKVVYTVKSGLYPKV